jgi:hypothetical protein
MMPDEQVGAVIEDNVFTPGNHTFGLTLYSDVGSVIRHNTWRGEMCAFSVPCGTLNLGNRNYDQGRGTVIRDNILASVSPDGNRDGSGVALFSSDHNLYSHSTAQMGPGDIRGVPTYVGPLSTYEGHRLAEGSPGSNAASDGLDVGIR